MKPSRSLRTGLLAAAGAALLALPAMADHGYGKRDYRGGAPGGAVLYADAGFSGEGLRIDGAEPDLARLRFNDRASSIEIRGGAWEGCVDSNFRGRCEIIDASTSSLKGYRLNDNISSLRPVGRNAGYDRGYDHRRDGRRGGWGGSLILYADSDLRGGAVEIDRDVADLNAYRFNDKASSFQVTGGTWQVCEHGNFGGRCEIISAGAGELKPIRMNDNISSVRRIDGRRY